MMFDQITQFYDLFCAGTGCGGHDNPLLWGLRFDGFDERNRREAFTDRDGMDPQWSRLPIKFRRDTEMLFPARPKLWFIRFAAIQAEQ